VKILAGIKLEVLIRAYRNLEVFGRLQQLSPGCLCRPRQVRFVASKGPLEFPGTNPSGDILPRSGRGNL